MNACDVVCLVCMMVSCSRVGMYDGILYSCKLYFISVISGRKTGTLFICTVYA